MKPRSVIVYSTPFCAPCESLKRFLAAHAVAFRVRDPMMDEEAQNRLEAAGIRTTPALEIDGAIYAGDQLEPQQLEAMLGLDAFGVSVS
jgi:glutaredoxin-like protein NrdH